MGHVLCAAFFLLNNGMGNRSSAHFESDFSIPLIIIKIIIIIVIIKQQLQISAEALYQKEKQIHFSISNEKCWFVFSEVALPLLY